MITNENNLVNNTMSNEVDIDEKLTPTKVWLTNSEIKAFADELYTLKCESLQKSTIKHTHPIEYLISKYFFNDSNEENAYFISDNSDDIGEHIWKQVLYIERVVNDRYEIYKNNFTGINYIINKLLDKVIAYVTPLLDNPETATAIKDVLKKVVLDNVNDNAGNTNDVKNIK